MTGFRMTVDTGYPGWMDRFGPHLDPGLTNVAAEAYTWIRHEEISSKNNKGHPDDEDPRKDTKKKPFFLDKVDDDLF